MKTITTTALVALMTAAIGLSAVAPTYAQPTAPSEVQMQKGPGMQMRHDNQGPGHGGRMGGGAELLSFERGAEAIEIALVRLSHRIELTAEQQPLFDAFKTDALAAAEDFETATEALRPAAPVEGEMPTMPGFSERLEMAIALQSARLAALESVQASATAFFDSLTEEQTAQLTPQRPDRSGMPGMGKGGPRHPGQHDGGPLGAPGAPPADAPAPADAPPADAPAPATNG